MGTQKFPPPGTAEPMRLRLTDLRSNGVRDYLTKMLAQRESPDIYTSLLALSG